MQPLQPTIVEMLVVAQQDDVRRSVRGRRRGRTVERRHLPRRRHTEAN